MPPLLNNLFSSLKLDNLTNNSSKIFKTLKNSLTSSINNLLANSTNAINKSMINPSLPSPSSLQSSLSSSLPSGTLEKICSIPFISKLCSGSDTVLNGINKSDNSLSSINGNSTGFKTNNNTTAASVTTANNLANESNSSNSSSSSNTLEKTLNDLFGLNNNIPNNSTTPTTTTDGGKGGFNASELNKLSGPFKALLNSSSNSTQAPNLSATLFKLVFLPRQ